MHLRKVSINNVRSIRDLTYEIPADRSSGWHVVLGNNGSGKSTFLRSVSLALVGAKDASGLRQPWSDWLSHGQQSGEISIELDDGPNLGVRFQRTAGQVALIDRADASESRLAERPEGLFAASYGPFRRFTGGDISSEKLFSSMPKLARHLSLFDESVSLSESLEWLKSLKFQSLETGGSSQFLDRVREFLNASGLLPEGVTLVDVNSKSVVFNDANGVDVPVEDLSDGFRSILSLTFELLRQLAAEFGVEGVFDNRNLNILASGIVIIDEIDAHLHPTWQQMIGRWFCEHFPNMQFLVSTHSPLVCQSAENGTIFVLPRSGTDDQAQMIVGEEFRRLVYGNVLDAYGTDAFGTSAASTRSESAKEKQRRLAELNTKEITRGLNDSELDEQLKLREMLPSIAGKVK